MSDIAAFILLSAGLAFLAFPADRVLAVLRRRGRK